MLKSWLSLFISLMHAYWIKALTVFKSLLNKHFFSLLTNSNLNILFNKTTFKQVANDFTLYKTNLSKKLNRVSKTHILETMINV